jgi:hypothetical protein
MGYLQSNLSSTGFDFVLAVTQDSINGALEELLYDSDQPELIICYAYDQDNNLTAIDYATLVANAANTDPFSVPATATPTDPRVQNLVSAGFSFAVKVKSGLPPGMTPASLPPIVTLQPGQSAVTYTLLFAEFVATQISYLPRNTVKWFSQSQPPGTAWTFRGTVELDSQEGSLADVPAYGQNWIMGNGGPSAFSIQQFLYDLNNTDLEQGFTFNDVPDDSDLNSFMTKDFINTYLKSLKGAEILGYGMSQIPATPPGSLALTDLNIFTPDPVGSEGAPTTMNYLCATSHEKLPDTTHAGFGWNWIEPAEVSQYDGVAALNRNTFAAYLSNLSQNNQTLLDYVKQNCLAPAVQVTYDVGKADTDYQFGMTIGQSPTVSFPASGSTILSYSYQSGTASDEAGVDGDMGQMKLSSSFDLSIAVQDNQIVVSQHLVIYTFIQVYQTSDDGNIVDKQITDTYTVGVDGSGNLVVALASTDPVDHSKVPGVNNFLNFFTDINSLTSSVAQWAQSLAATTLSDIPVAIAQNFVFPSGRVFVYADACFSDNQDLVSHITYPDPSAAATRATARRGGGRSEGR